MADWKDWPADTWTICGHCGERRCGERRCCHCAPDPDKAEILDEVVYSWWCYGCYQDACDDI